MKRSILYFLLATFFLFGCGDGLKGMESDYTIKVIRLRPVAIQRSLYNRRYGGHAQTCPSQWEGVYGIHRQGAGCSLCHSKNDFRRHTEGGNPAR